MFFYYLADFQRITSFKHTQKLQALWITYFQSFIIFIQLLKLVWIGWKIFLKKHGNFK